MHDTVPQIAKYYSDCYKYHDLRKWKKMQQSVANYLIALGYEKDCSRTAAAHIVKSYQQSDVAFSAQQRGNRLLEEKQYGNVQKEMLLAYSGLGMSTQPVFYKILWYKAFRHKNYVQMTWNYFMEQLTLFGPGQIDLAFTTTYNAYKVSSTHNARDWKALKSAMIEFWVPIAKRYTDKLPVEF